MAKITLKKRFVVFLAAVLMLLSGCMSGELEERTPSLGRYVEEVVTLPGDLGYTYFITALSSGKIGMAGDTIDGIKYWVYEDGVWVDQDAQWCQALNELDILWLEDISMGVDGTVYCFYHPLEEDMEPAGYEGFREDILIPEPVLAYYSEGEWRDTGILLVSRGTVAEAFRVLDSGGIAAGYYNYIITYDRNGAITGEYPSNGMWNANFMELDGAIAFTDKGRLKLYNLWTGEPQADIALEQNSFEQVTEYAIGRRPQTAFCWDGEHKAICYANKSGIYQVTADGSLTEKLVDGSLSSLMMPTVEILQLIACEDGSFLLFAIDPEYQPMLFRYRYEASVPTTPTTELRVFSLYDTPTIRQAMGSFQRNNPDVTVRYDVGIPENSSITYQDALQTLSTQMLAGNGPDLLVLDYLPIDSYLEKEILTDVGEPQGELFENITGAFRQGENLYAVPAAFLLPLLLAEEEDVLRVQTPAELEQYMRGRDNPRIGFDGEYLFVEMARYYMHRWLTVENTLDTQAFAQDLRAFDEMQRQLLEVGNSVGGAWGGDFIQSGLVWKEKSINLCVRSLFAINNLRGPYTALKERNGTLTLYPQDEWFFIPRVILGVNANGKQPDLARSFIAHVLSEQQQCYELGDGLPVNRAAYRFLLEAHEENEQVGVWGLEKVDPETGELEFFTAQAVWPDRSFQQYMVEMAESANMPLIIDPIVEEIIVEEAYRYFRGQCTLEEAVSGAERRINLRQWE